MPPSKQLPSAGSGFACLQCGSRFKTLQALGGHKSVHSAGRKRAAPASASAPSQSPEFNRSFSAAPLSPLLHPVSDEHVHADKRQRLEIPRAPKSYSARYQPIPFLSQALDTAPCSAPADMHAWARSFQEGSSLQQKLSAAAAVGGTPALISSAFQGSLLRARLLSLQEPPMNAHAQSTPALLDPRAASFLAPYQLLAPSNFSCKAPLQSLLCQQSWTRALLAQARNPPFLHAESQELISGHLNRVQALRAGAAGKVYSVDHSERQSLPAGISDDASTSSKAGRSSKEPLSLFDLGTSEDFAEVPALRSGDDSECSSEETRSFVTEELFSGPLGSPVSCALHEKNLAGMKDFTRREQIDLTLHL